MTGCGESSLELAAQHRRLIDESAIYPDVARERGYCTITSKAELERLGFAQAQRCTPGLLIPIRGVTGEIATYQLRPDAPRVKDGKPLKYETPRLSRMVLDVPLRCRSRGWLGDPKRPLFLTEGARKADAGVSKNLFTIALLGVWNWRGTNEHGGKALVADWESIALNGRTVYICFDSDVMTKRGVYQSMVRLKPMLELRHAHVRVIYLPPGDGGTKVGLDDFFVAGGTIDQLLGLATEEVRGIGAEADHARYATTSDGRTVYRKPTGEAGTVDEQLANFTAEIVEVVSETDGAESRSLYRIRARVRGITREITVPVERFSAMHWPAEQLGPKAIVHAGFGCRERLREAIQVLSPEEIPERHVYVHLGWTQVGNEWVYLHAGGAIGANGALSDVAVRAAPPLDRYVLPVPAEGADLARAVRESLSLLDGLAPDHVMFPLFSLPWIAVLRSAGQAAQITGKTGVRKSEIAALLQRHFGVSMDAEHLPGSWSSTANAQEGVAFLAKDSVYTVDDYNPTGSAADIQRAWRDADRFVRAQANGSARGRLSSDGTPRPPKPPRGVVLSTGEDIPPGHSLRARLLVVELGEGDVDLAKLTQRQHAAPYYSQAMAGFIRWVASRLEDLRTHLAAEREHLRDELLPRVAHGRTATLGADLIAALRVVLLFAVEVKAIDQSNAIAVERRGRIAILRAMQCQREHQAAANPAQQFPALVASALQSGEAHLVDRKSGGRPGSDEIARSAGWRCDERGHVPEGWRPGGPQIGWVDSDGDSIYLDPTSAFRAAQKQADASASRIGTTEKTLWKRLAEAGLLVSSDSGRHTLKLRLNSATTVNVLHLRRSLLFGEPGTSGTEGTDTEEEAGEEPVFPIRVPDSDGESAGTGTHIGNRPHPNQPSARQRRQFSTPPITNGRLPGIEEAAHEA